MLKWQGHSNFAKSTAFGKSESQRETFEGHQGQDQRQQRRGLLGLFFCFGLIKIDLRGDWTNDLRINVQVLYQLSYPTLCRWSPDITILTQNVAIAVRQWHHFGLEWCHHAWILRGVLLNIFALSLLPHLICLFNLFTGKNIWKYTKLWILDSWTLEIGSSSNNDPTLKKNSVREKGINDLQRQW